MEDLKNVIKVSKKYEIAGLNFIIENVGSNFNIVFDSNINIGINGELGIATTKNINFDTIGSKFYINSRKSTLIKDLPESIEYRKKQEEEHKKHLEMLDMEHNTFIDRIEKLENEIKEIKLLIKGGNICQALQD